MSDSVTCRLVDYLEDLLVKEFKKFKLHLEEYPLEDGYRPIKRRHTEKAEAIEIAQLMVKAYEEQKALQMTVNIFDKINRKDLSERVQREMPIYFRQPARPLTQEEEREREKKILSNSYDKFFGTPKKVHVTLDPQTAFPALILSEDRKSVHLGERAQPLPDNPERFNMFPCVLGKEGIDTGTADWVVEVGRAKSWSIGVVQKSIDRKWYQYVTATKGYWALELKGGEYSASSTPSTVLTLWKSPRRIHVHLEYEFYILSFYNADSKEHLFTFNYPFYEVLFPFFQVWDKEIPLKICPLGE
ncbi:hypothetical protein JRQ81_005475 [Phrynocephalus forsythii]|uniref:B30.2/SPRY domain-containing protein n=1 Tax=Phrynocephalus forsythii TaxID=171643 RepID=A0A9Q1AVM7_9SAUR|nr:hypothetical protein JRQ81_005475 [Phrynocephalus forsythii]